MRLYRVPFSGQHNFNACLYFVCECGGDIGFLSGNVCICLVVVVLHFAVAHPIVSGRDGSFRLLDMFLQATFPFSMAPLLDHILDPLRCVTRTFL